MSSQERREVFYPKPHVKELLDGYNKISGLSKSAIANKALQEHFKNMTAEERQRIRNAAKK